jgi:hypothetical protein
MTNHLEMAQKEDTVASFKEVSSDGPGGSSGLPIRGPRYEPGTCQIRNLKTIHCFSGDQ